MKTIAIIDLECTGLDPATDKIIEVGVVLWSVEHRTILECYSSLLPAESNAASRFNGISEDVLKQSSADAEVVWQVVSMMVDQADAVVAHQADFDWKFVCEEIEKLWQEPVDRGYDRIELFKQLLDKPWICTVEDFEWPAVLPYKNLTAVALAHGVAVTSAHRSIHDCLLLARCFEEITKVDQILGYPRFDKALARSRRPKAEFVSLAPFEENAVVKAAGFHWDADKKQWRRRMAVEDAEKLPFSVAVAT